MAIPRVLARFAGLSALLWLFTAQMASGQGVFVPTRTVTGTVNGITRPVVATITVCAAGASGIPCSPALAGTLFKDSALTQPLANPTVTDANGNYPQMALGGGNYTFTETAAGFTGFSYQMTISCAPGPCTVTTLTVSGALNANGGITTTTLIATGASTISNINGDVYLDGVKYATLAAAVAALPSGGTLHISAGTYTVTASLAMVTNLDIECSPNNATILQASASLNAPLISASSINHFRVAGCVLDGNRAGNTNQFNLLTVASSSHGEIISNHFQNNQSKAIQLTAGNSHIRINDNEINNYGQALPASIGNEGIAVQPLSGGLGNSHIEISSNRVHDGNIGIAVYTSSNTANTTSDIDLAHNRVWAMANDGILPFSANQSGALMQGIRIEDNESYCNGWPANGTGFSANCTAGLLQAGSTASSSGVGIDLNSTLLDQPVAIGNRTHDNFYEGIDAVGQTITTVNCTNVANSVCTVVSGDPFNVAWKPNQTVFINGIERNLLASPASTATLTVTSNTGALSGVSFTGISLMRGTLVGNVSYNNGRGASGTQGSGFSDSAYGNTWSNNVSYNNQYVGFIDQASSFVTHTGDKAYNNGLRAGGQPGFFSQGALNPSYINVTTDDSQAVPTQTFGLWFDANTNNAYADSGNIAATTLVNDLGVGDSWRIGKTLFGQPPCLVTAGAGGTYCLQGGATGGAFTATLPAANGTLSPLVAQDCGATSTCSATNISSTVKMIKGSAPLVSGTPSTVTITGINPAFSSSSSYVCTVSNATTQANPVKAANVSASSFTVTGPSTVTDTVNYVCAGN